MNDCAGQKRAGVAAPGAGGCALGPSLFERLERTPEQDVLQRLALLRADQFRRWQGGERVPVEAYRAAVSFLRADGEALVDFIFSEVLVREALGEAPGPDEYLRRFPEHADALRLQFEVHGALRGSVLAPDPETPPHRGPGTGAGDSTRDRSTGDNFGNPDNLPFPAPPSYEVLGVLGQGGMGVVLRARHRQLNRLVALKMILAGPADDATLSARFLAEARAVARLQHPNIVQVYETGESAGCPFVALEYVEGGSLSRRTAGAPQPPGRAAEWTETLARAMDVAHRQGIVHRDLKPANVLLTPDGQLKVADFGLAKRLDEDSGQTRTGDIMGTPGYMAPEQAWGRNHHVGPAADVYALGAILYELLTGRPPFQGPTALETVDQVRHCEPVPPRRLQPAVPRDLETVCLKCLHKEPGRRYASAAALADDLHRFRAGEPVLARPVPLWERVARWARRRKVTAALLVLAALALGSAGAWLGEHVRGRLRLAQLRVGAQELVLKGQAALAGQRLEDAQELLARAHGMARTEPSLDDLREVVDPLLEQVTVELADRSARGRAQAHFLAFQQCRHQVLFQETLLTGLSRDDGVRTARELAPAELAEYGVTLTSEGAPAGDARLLGPEQQAALLPGCYELLLAWAEATAYPLASAHEEAPTQARAALQILDRAGRLGLATRTFHLRRARYLRQAGDADAARAESERAASLEPASAVDFFLVGLEAYGAGRLDEAHGHFRRALALQPNHYWAHYSEALCLLREQRFDAAVAHLTACLGLQPRLSWAHLLRGFALGELGRYDEAEDDFARAEQLDQDATIRYGLHVNRGLVLVRRGRLDGAVESFRRALVLKPDQYQAHANLAEAYQQQGRLDEAQRHLDRAVELQPSAALFRTRARLHLKRQDADRALADLNEAVRREPAGERSIALARDHVERGRILLQRRRYVDAQRAFEDAVNSHPADFPLAHRLRAEVLLDREQYAEALRTLDRYLATKGEPTAALYQARGLARARLHDYPGAVAEYARSLELDRLAGTAPDPLTLTSRGWVYLVLESPRLALEDFAAAAAREPANADALNGRGHARALLGQWRAAAADAEAAVKLGPPSPRLLYNAARTFSQIAGRLDADPAQRGRCLLYQERALQLLQQAMGLLPRDQRGGFWRDMVESDPVLRPVRELHGFKQLAAEHGPRETGR